MGYIKWLTCETIILGTSPDDVSQQKLVLTMSSLVDPTDDFTEKRNKLEKYFCEILKQF